MLSFRNLLVVLVAWTATSAVWLADGSGAMLPKPTYATLPDGPAAAQPQQPQKEISPASIPSSPDALPLSRLSDDLLYTAYLLHPWPNVLAAVSGQFRDSLNKFRTHDYAFRTPRPAIGIGPWGHMEGLVQRKTPLLGKYRLTVKQSNILLIMAGNSFRDLAIYSTQPKYDAEYLTHVIEDLLEQPTIQYVNLLDVKSGGTILKNAVSHFLTFCQPDLACKLIRAVGRPIGPDDVVAAVGSHRHDVLTKLCKLAEDLPEQVAFTKDFIEAKLRPLSAEDFVGFWYEGSQEDFNTMMECYLKVAKPTLEH